MKKIDAVIAATESDKMMTSKWCAIQRGRCVEYCAHFRKAKAYTMREPVWHINLAGCKLWGGS